MYMEGAYTLQAGVTTPYRILMCSGTIEGQRKGVYGANRRI